MVDEVKDCCARILEGAFGAEDGAVIQCGTCGTAWQWDADGYRWIPGQQ